MQSSRRLALATSRPRSWLVVRAKSRETPQAISTTVLLPVSELESALAYAGAWRDDTIVEEARKPTRPPSALAPRRSWLRLLFAPAHSPSRVGPMIRPASVSAGAMLVRAASNNAVAAFGASGTIAASHGTSRSIALPANTLDET